ncbi:MAG TPA: DUF1571 domain-containing protein [Candidatus Eisenbacteria bacterium]|nr:DUF1571 domain-containing protein [Candidatus Eisenbacteria bacterium]
MKKTTVPVLAAVLAVFALGAAPAPSAPERQLLSEVSTLRDSEAAPLASELEGSLRAWEALHDYTAVFHKQELTKEKDALGPNEEIFLKFEKPFKIYLGWLNTPKKGLQVLYERGRHQGKLAIHKPGLLLGLAPVIFLEQSSPYVREGSASYDIEDAGIGTFLMDFTKAVLRSAREKKLRFSRIGGSGYDVTFSGTSRDDDYFAHRVRVLFDPPTRLPVRMELFDWEDRPMGVYLYDRLKVDVGSQDPEFKKNIDRHLFRVYRGD